MLVAFVSISLVEVCAAAICSDASVSAVKTERLAMRLFRFRWIVGYDPSLPSERSAQFRFCRLDRHKQPRQAVRMSFSA